MFTYKFKQFYEWYTDNIDSDLFEENRDIAIYKINQTSKYEKLSNKQIRKRQLMPLTNEENAYLGLFNKTNIEDIAEFKFIKNSKYPNGLYCVIDNNAIYTFFPREKNNIICADHFTFLEDNVHQTTYTPSLLNNNIGNVMHIPRSKLLDGIELPLIGYQTDIFKKMHIYKEDILDIIRVCYRQNGSGPSLAISKTNKIKKPNKKINIEISTLLEQLLLIHEIRNIKIFCFKNQITTFAESDDKLYNNFTFKVKNQKWSTIQEELCKILKNKKYLSINLKRF